MVNCDKGKANTVHPECIGEQHYSDDHGTGSAIKMAKAPDVDLEKGDGQAAPDPTVENALEKAGETRGSPVKEGTRMNPYPGKHAKYIGPKSLGEPVSGVDVAYKGDTRSPAPPKAHQNPARAPQHYIDPVTGKALNDSDVIHASSVTMEEHNAPYREQALREKAQKKADDALFNEMARRYSGLGFKQWDGETFRRTYENMMRNPEQYQTRNPAYYKAVMDIYDSVMQDDANAKKDAALKARANAHAEAMQRQKWKAISEANANPQVDSVPSEDAIFGIHDPKYKRLGPEAEAEYNKANPQTQQNSYKPQDREFTPVEMAGRKANEVEDAPRTITPEGSNLPVSQKLTHNWKNPYRTDATEGDSSKFTGSHADASKALSPNAKVDPDTKGAERQATADKKLQTKTPPATPAEAQAVNEATGGLGTPNATKQSAKRLSAKGILTPEEFHARAAKGQKIDTSKPTDRKPAYTPPKSDNMENSARTDFPSFDELKKSGVKDLTVMWNDLLKSSDMEKAWAEERSWSDDEAINDAIDEDSHNKYQHRADQLRRKGAKEETFSREADKHFADTDTEYVNSAIGAAQRADNDNAKLKSWGKEPNREVNVHEAMHKSEETGTVDRPNVIQKSFKQMMDEGSEKKIGTYGAPAGSNPYGYPLRGNGMPIQNGYQQVFISREDMVMPPIGQMKHTKN